jgi:hypothetical protein
MPNVEEVDQEPTEIKANGEIMYRHLGLAHLLITMLQTFLSLEPHLKPIDYSYLIMAFVLVRDDNQDTMNDRRTIN